MIDLLMELTDPWYICRLARLNMKDNCKRLKRIFQVFYKGIGVFLSLFSEKRKLAAEEETTDLSSELHQCAADFWFGKADFQGEL